VIPTIEKIQEPATAQVNASSEATLNTEGLEHAGQKVSEPTANSAAEVKDSTAATKYMKRRSTWRKDPTTPAKSVSGEDTHVAAKPKKGFWAKVVHTTAQ
jgi:hypothetical protein